MRVLVDTSVWSLALRRTRRNLDAAQHRIRATLVDLIGSGNAVLLGPVRQELLSGIRESLLFERLREQLSFYDDEPLETADYEEAAQIYNRCRAKGISGGATDFLICAAAIRRSTPLFTLDDDFQRYSKHCSLTIFKS